MLYANTSSSDFPHFTEALRKCGIREETIALVPEYFNTENPRNDRLLDTITPQNLFNAVNRNRSAVDKAIKKEILADKTGETLDRYILFMYAVGRETVDYFLNNAINYNTSKKSWQEWHDTVLHALQLRYGEDAPCILAAIDLYRPSMCNITSYCYSVGNHSGIDDLHVLDFTEQTISRLLVILSVLDTKEDPKKGLKALFSGKDADLQRIKETLTAIGPTLRGYTQDVHATYLAAVTSAAVFMEDFLPIVHQLREKEVGTRCAEFILRTGMTHKGRLLDLLEGGKSLAPGYIRTVANNHNINGSVLTDYPERMAALAKRFPADYKKDMLSIENASLTGEMGRIYASVHPEEDDDEAKAATKERCIQAITAYAPQYAAAVRDYLNGGSMEELLKTVPLGFNDKRPWGSSNGTGYIEAYGLDEFAERCIAAQMLMNCQDDYRMRTCPGFWLCKTEYVNGAYQKKYFHAQFVEILHRRGLPFPQILTACGSIAESEYSAVSKKQEMDRMAAACKPYSEEIAAVDPKPLPVPARVLYIEILHAAGMDSRLFALTEDGSKAVKALLGQYLPAPGGDFDDEIMALLTAKKSAKREIAAALLERNFPESFRDAVQKAADTEKTASLQTRFALLLGAEIPQAAAEKNTEDVVTSLTKGSKTKKVAWLYENPYAPVHKTDGTEAEEVYLQALLLCYAAADRPGRSQTADNLAAALKPEELESFAGEVFGRWLHLGAQAKTKWVLYFTAIHGGMKAQESILAYIKEWAEHSRGAIACDAVNALAMNGSSYALMAVDNLARKFKKRQVKEAANSALQSAAQELGLTREELADKIVPDLGFDRNRCRVFDFGTRQFSVYLTPALELEIFEGDKRLKNLPKPGAKDDAEQSAIAVKDFKEMKKQMKTAVQSQRQRLEYVLLCDRKWTAEGWRALFIEKPVMHCFAIGLIWGVYENGKLTQTFRYLEDGSFNTYEEEEYTLPENASVGLVHPLELDEESLAAWKEQLSDYEIVQPFPQLDRPVYRVTEEEKNQTELQRFGGHEMGAMTLLGRMTKAGWEKGQAQDAGMFYEFTRSDITRQYPGEDGHLIREGWEAELEFTGMYIGGYYEEAEDVSVEKVVFRKAGAQADALVKLGEVPERYFSEVVAQLTAAVGVRTEEDAE